MPTFDSVAKRENVPVPEQVAKDVIKDMTRDSVILANARRVPMSTKTYKQPVLAELPDAYWVNGDTGLKQTSVPTWKDVVMTAEELAVLVPIPDALVDDSSIPLWSEVKPLLTEAIGRKLDLAALWGDDKPTSWPTAIVPAATAASQTVNATADLTADVAQLGKALAKAGYAATGFLCEPGFNWQLVSLRGQDGHPIYTPSLVENQPDRLYGRTLTEVLNGAWKATSPKATHLIALDWKKIAVGIRQDFTFSLFDQMVISDADGKVIFNAAQQDAKVMRLVFRVGFQVAQPATRVGSGAAYPAAVLVEA